MSRPAPRGFTLLEVILALALMALLLGIVAMAVDTYWRATTRGRAAVENAQLARALLSRIADDLRASVAVSPDYSAAISNVSGSAGSDALSSFGAGADDDLLGEDDADENDPADEPPREGTSDDGFDNAAPDDESGLSPNATGEAGDIASSGSISAAEAPWGAFPGVYGNQYELQVDVSRALRSDQSRLAQATSAGAALPLGVTTLSYFVQQESTSGLATSNGEPASAGLIRRETNRVVAASSGGAAIVDPMAQQVDLLAPEVVGLEFRYFDGVNWLLAWDSAEMQSSPVAVEILLSLAPLGTPREAGLIRSANLDTTNEELRYYRLVVHLPGMTPGTPSADVSSTGAAGAMGL